MLRLFAISFSFVVATLLAQPVALAASASAASYLQEFKVAQADWVKRLTDMGARFDRLGIDSILTVDTLAKPADRSNALATIEQFKSLLVERKQLVSRIQKEGDTIKTQDGKLTFKTTTQQREALALIADTSAAAKNLNQLLVSVAARQVGAKAGADEGNRAIDEMLKK